MNDASPVGADEDETDCFSEVLDGSDQKYILARNCSVLHNPTAGFTNLIFDSQETSVKEL